MGLNAEGAFPRLLQYFRIEKLCNMRAGSASLPPPDQVLILGLILQNLTLAVDFGPYRLEESRRTLLLQGQEVALQPKVFDLLVYLIRHRDRVVSKDELLSALWPEVTVTENSLQRAVSALRTTLRTGDMDEAIRNFPGTGYRFQSDVEAAIEEVAGKADGREEARRAAAEQRWSDADVLYSGLKDSAALEGADYDLWAMALQCLGHPSKAIPILLDAVNAHSEASSYGAAAASAVVLSTIHLERGEMTLAKGWLARAQDLVQNLPDCAAAGRLLWMKSRVAMVDGDMQSAIALANAAYEHGRQTRRTDTEALGLMYRGFHRLSLGDTEAGIADQDHAATIALSSNIDPITSGVLYCNILWACRSFGDWTRADEWTLGYQRLCTDNRMGFSGSCQLHRAEVLGVHGSLQDAFELVSAALARLPDDAPWALGDAHRVLGDIQSGIGNSKEAMTSYQTAYALGWNPEPGHAMLLIEAGEADAACAALERSLEGQSWWSLQRRGVLQAYLAIASLRAEKPEKASALIADLTGQSARWPMPSIRALTNEASAIMCQASGRVDEALRHYHLARQLWTSVGCRLNATRLRIELARLQLEVGDTRGAATELRAASSVAIDLGSTKLASKSRMLAAELGE